MATAGVDDTDELIAALEACCARLRGEGSRGGGDGSSDDPLDVLFEPSEDGGPRWRSLTLGEIPGLDEVIGIIKPPLQIIASVLEIVIALLKALKVILIGILDPFKALIEAAYKLLADFINDLLNTGAYAYWDAPGITSPASTLGEVGSFENLDEDFEAGRSGDKPAPPYVPDAFDYWGARFEASFDDAGDTQRPVLSDGATAAALFIVVAAPTPQALRRLMYFIGRLINIDAFVSAFEEFEFESDDPDRSRLRRQSVAPDWHARRLQDLFPELRELMAIPRAFKSLLSKVEDLTGLINRLADALQGKIETLQAILDTVQAIIDLLDALKAAGLYVLSVATSEGSKGLKEAFVEASNRPEGGLIAGVCFLASGPNIGAAATLFQLLDPRASFDVVKSTFEETYETMKEDIERQGIVDDINEAAQQIEDDAELLADRVESFPEDIEAAVGRTIEEIKEGIEWVRHEMVDELVATAEEYGNELFVEPVQRSIEQTEAAREHGVRSLTMGFGDLPDTESTLPQSPPPEGGEEGE